MRIPFMKLHNLEEFEFSQNYLFFWDKVERSLFFLHAYAETARNGEEPDGRLLNFLLTGPVDDGGQFDMLINIVEKYGVIPKKCFPEAHNAEATRRMNVMLRCKLREYALRLRLLIKDGRSEQDVQSEIDRAMTEIYRIIVICLGSPPEMITWEYHDKTKAYRKVGPVSPKDFYENYVKSVYNISDKVCIVNDPRPGHHYGKLYTVDYLNNMHGGKKCLYVNQPSKTLKEYALKSIKNDEPVWFGCDVGKACSWKHGINDMDLYNYELVFGVPMFAMTKAERLEYCESMMTHAMLITGVGTENGSDGEEVMCKWRVENSWGDDKGDKGYLMMTDKWFDEFVYEVTIDKKYLAPEVLAVLDQEPIVLPAWDPMGALA
uniref:Bleomycin hydrolase n=1 Tax=Saccoglossus kowalevskii TaxID=10224 RepID=A0ABM0MJD3_SACKO|nr:PREDICTED: bleomycin hydrolase-like [Saccoglossus kowalevskii]